MKKTIVLIAAVIALGSSACHNEEKTDDNKVPYGTADTTNAVNVNSAADSAHGSGH
jgi:hypothetical protein